MNVTYVANRAQVAAFVAALFPYADKDSWVSLRAFSHDNKPWPSVQKWLSVPPTDVVAVATDFATRAANAWAPVVFCPLVATFNSRERARTENLANGLALSVECDQLPAAARRTLEDILGPATIVVLIPRPPKRDQYLRHQRRAPSLAKSRTFSTSYATPAINPIAALF